MQGSNTSHSNRFDSRFQFQRHTLPAQWLRCATRFVALLAVLSLPLLHTGCVAIAAAGAGAGAYAVMRGSLESHVQAGFNKTLDAVRSELPRTGLIKIKELSDQESAKLTFRDALDTRITVELQEQSKDLTEVRIRVGALGNEDRSIEILRAIHRALNVDS